MNVTEKQMIDKNQSTHTIIGNGLIGGAFKENPARESIHSVVIFASGVSNSLEIAPKPFLREKKLLESVLENKKKLKKFIYFSTLSVYDKTKQDAAYIKHKLKLEETIRQECQNYLIIRVPNIIGKGGNPTTLLNYLITSVLNKTEIKVFKNAYRNFIDVEDLVKVVTQFIVADISNTTIDLLHPISYSMVEVISCIEKHVNLTSNSVYVEQGYDYFPTLNQLVHSTFQKSNINMRKDYLSQILAKYY
ncbi:NAD dependent epimerase/dehydratase family protein [Bernardetia litoralis DSM 6794]|uniref:dTDP-4-dehydrorhamnose reductase n=1 Tax=Bernardetia litoralis (strain ATCC 23117 / DSM 6794 / NBRC 15988 / NCIMB 1366 / Fx l1 / Sio-4) TaxID=880071 RepID=I4AJZ5_BERLS|nr:NAD-dependent epimerase/dehydratase family protein [Bernardetia litoralis]AFM04280.1 NAD dependent epimerase/dehydratase family protein [Bernardetia litoralis DSM 6794]